MEGNGKGGLIRREVEGLSKCILKINANLKSNGTDTDLDSGHHMMYIIVKTKWCLRKRKGPQFYKNKITQKNVKKNG